MLHRYLPRFRTMKFLTQTRFGGPLGPTDIQWKFQNKHCRRCAWKEVRSRTVLKYPLVNIGDNMSTFATRKGRLTKTNPAGMIRRLLASRVTQTITAQVGHAVPCQVNRPGAIDRGQTTCSQNLSSCSAADLTCISLNASSLSWTDSCSKSTIGGMAVAQTVLTVIHLLNAQAPLKSSIPAGTPPMIMMRRQQTSGMLNNSTAPSLKANVSMSSTNCAVSQHGCNLTI